MQVKQIQRKVCSIANFVHLFMNSTILLKFKERFWVVFCGKENVNFSIHSSLAASQQREGQEQVISLTLICLQISEMNFLLPNVSEKTNIIHLMKSTFDRRRFLMQGKYFFSHNVLREFKHFLSYGGEMVSLTGFSQDFVYSLINYVIEISFD
jgi:hypothetical protein